MTVESLHAELEAVDERVRQIRSAADQLESLSTRLLSDCASLLERLQRYERFIAALDGAGGD